MILCILEIINTEISKKNYAKNRLEYPTHTQKFNWSFCKKFYFKLLDLRFIYTESKKET